MLVLRRKVNETIKIADGLITITVVHIEGDQVRIGIDAPRDISVHRGEIQRMIDQEAKRKTDDPQ